MAARRQGRTAVNFPRPGTGETQAIKGERWRTTMRRAGAKKSDDAGDDAGSLRGSERAAGAEDSE